MVLLMVTRGRERTARDKLAPPWCPLGVRDLGRREEDSPRLARLRQLEDAAAAKAALASAIAAWASSRGIFLELVHHVAIGAERESRVVAELAGDVDKRTPLM